MKMNATLVPDKARVADIGCDHGYVAMWLVKEKNCKPVIATDVNEGPLKRAEKNIRAMKLEEMIEVRQGDGLTVLKPGEVDTVLIAGMGGMLMCEMLSAAPGVLKTTQTLILQPQSDVEEVRRHLHKLGYRIDKESICLEDGKYYFAIRAVPGEEDEPYTDTEYRFSRLLAEEGGTVYRGYMRMMTDKIADLLKTLDLPDLDIGDRTRERKAELEQELNQLRETFK